MLHNWQKTALPLAFRDWPISTSECPSAGEPVGLLASSSLCWRPRTFQSSAGGPPEVWLPTLLWEPLLTKQTQKRQFLNPREGR